MSKIMIDKIKDANLDHIFDCGQCFRWNKENDGSYTGVAMGKAVNIKLSGSQLYFENATADDFNEIWSNYLDLFTDYEKIKNTLAQKDEQMKKAIQTGYGIRILRQDLWETIVSFIISANNNIPRIKGCVESLCENFGEYLGEFKGKKRYSFPGPEVLAKLTTDDLAICRLGYRARYIIESAKKYIEDKEGFENLKNDNVTSQEAFEKLRTLSGVGPKVANCILLFGLAKHESFPIDVWVKRVMNYLYDIDEDDVKEMEKYAIEHFGDKAGIAQQYLFYYMRNVNLGVK